jgi:hypothetical protein
LSARQQIKRASAWAGRVVLPAFCDTRGQRSAQVRLGCPPHGPALSRPINIGAVENSISAQPPGLLRQIDLGDIVIYGGQRFYARGVDPIGVCSTPRRAQRALAIAPWRSASWAATTVREVASRSSGPLPFLTSSSTDSIAASSFICWGARESAPPRRPRSWRAANPLPQSAFEAVRDVLS